MKYFEAPFNELFKLLEPIERLPKGAICYKTGAYQDIYLVVVSGSRLGLVIIGRDFEIEMLDPMMNFFTQLGAT